MHVVRGRDGHRERIIRRYGTRGWYPVAGQGRAHYRIAIDREIEGAAYTSVIERCAMGVEQETDAEQHGVIEEQQRVETPKEGCRRRSSSSSIEIHDCQ